MAANGVLRLALTKVQGSGGDNNALATEYQGAYKKGKKGAKK